MKSHAPKISRLIVPIQVRRPIVGGHQNVHVAIAVEISASQPPPNFRCFKSSSSRLPHILKFSTASVQEELGRLTVSRVAADIPHRFIDVPVGHRQVQRTIKIDIKK